MPSIKQDIEDFLKIPYNEVVSYISGNIKDYRKDLWLKTFPWGVKKDNIFDYYRSDQYAATLFKEAVDIFESQSQSEDRHAMPGILADTVARYEVVELTNGVITDPRILYYGCGNAMMLFELIGMNKWNITLADVGSTYFEFLKYLSNKYSQLNGLKFLEINKDNEYPVQGSRKYDIIIVDRVLEHVFDPIKTIQYLCSHLEDMGNIYITSNFADDFIDDDPSNISLINPDQREKWNATIEYCGLKQAILDIKSKTGIWQKVEQMKKKVEVPVKEHRIFPTSISFLSTVPDEQCGISTYTNYLCHALNKKYPANIFRDINRDVPDNSAIVAQIEFGIFPPDNDQYKQMLLNKKYSDNWKFAMWHTVFREPTGPILKYIQEIDKEYDMHLVHTVVQKTWLSRVVNKPVEIIPHGTLLWDTMEKDAAKKIISKEYSGLISESDRIMFAFGFAAENKGLEQLVDAAKLVKTPNFKLVISGAPHGAAKEFTQRIIDSLKKRVDTGNVVILGKHLADDEINLWASAADILVFNYTTPPHVSSASGAMKRVLAAGKPILCVDDNRLEELVNGQHCIKYTMGNKSDLIKSIDMLLSDSEMANKLGRNCRLLAEQTSWDKIADKYEDIISRLAGTIGPEYYDEEYFIGISGGKKFVDPSGEFRKWSYYNEKGEWLGAEPIMKSIKTVLNPDNMLSVGEGRGTFVAYARDAGIQAIGQDFSKWAVDNPYQRAKGLVTLGDVRDIKFSDYSFDLVFCSDIMEHVYVEDLPKAISEIQRVSNKFIFYNIGASMGDDTKEDMVLQKNKLPPKDRQVTAIAGHVTVKSDSWWRKKLSNKKWKLRDDLVDQFRSMVPKEVLENWRCVLITERVDKIPEHEKPDISSIINPVSKNDVTENTNKKPKISFVMVTARDDHPYVGRPDLNIFEPTIESLKHQTMMDFEWVIVDQLYDDRKDYFKNMKLPFKVKHVPSRPNVWHDVGLCGVCTQYNKGIIYADGELLFFFGEGYLFVPEFCERLWGHYKEGYIPFSWYFYDNTFTPKDQLEPVPKWKVGYPEDMDSAPANYDISGYIGKNVSIEHRPIHAFKGNDLKVFPAPWEWWFGLSSTPLEAMLKINGFDQRFDGDRMLLDCDVGSRLNLAGFNRFALFRDLFTIRARTDTNIWNPKLVKCGPTIKCNLPLIHWSRFRNKFRANESDKITDEDLRWIKDEFCGQTCTIREQCRTEHPWQFPFEHKEGYGHLSKKKWFDYWLTHQVKINLTEERIKRLSGDEKYREGTFI